MGRNPTSERKVRGMSAPGALVLQPAARDAAPMPRAPRRRSTVAPSPARRRQPPIRTAYEHFRLERQGALVSRSTLDFYDAMVVPFLTWLDGEGVERFEHMGVEHARLYRARLASTPGRHGRPLQPDTLHGSHRAIGTFLRWACKEGYGIDSRILELPAPRIPEKEPTVYHIAQVRKLLAACNVAVPTEDLIVRVLVGSGIRRAEVCGLSVTAPDGCFVADAPQPVSVHHEGLWKVPPWGQPRPPPGPPPRPTCGPAPSAWTTPRGCPHLPQPRRI